MGKIQVLKNELNATGAITSIAESSSPPTETWFTVHGFTWKGKDPNLREDFATMGITHDYAETVSWKFIQGRNYSRDFSTDSSAVILNEAAVRFMGLQDPIHEEITWKGKKFTVIGVIQDMIMDSPYYKAKQAIYFLDSEGKAWINIRLNPEMNSREAIAKIETVFQKIIPSIPFDFKFTDQEYALKFANEERISNLANLFATLAIFISCIGLFGMASFMAEQRKKEIGIRKVLGASVLTIWKSLSSEFVFLVGISCIIGIPVSGYFLSRWLEKYEYRMEISVWIFAATILGALTLALITVSFQTIKAALVNPVESLKSE